jgi:ABC-type sulfate/molybdate transport systems ATPase subunit
MVVRLGFSVATALQPDILLVDEVLAVGDIKFRLKAQQAIRKVLKNGTSLIMVSHNLHELSGNTNTCFWMEKGQIRLAGETRYVCSEYLVSQSGNSHATLGVGNFYDYSPNRSGHIILTDLKHSLDKAETRGLPSVEAPDQNIELELTFEAVELLSDQVVHAFNLTTLEKNYVGRVALTDYLDLKKGQCFERKFCFKIPDLLPGRYRLE